MRVQIIIDIEADSPSALFLAATDAAHDLSLRGSGYQNDIEAEIGMPVTWVVAAVKVEG